MFAKCSFEKQAGKKKEPAQSKKIIGRLAHTKDPLLWGSVIVSLSVPVPWRYKAETCKETTDETAFPDRSGP